MHAYATRGLGFLVCCATISRQLGQGRLRSGGSPLFMIYHRSSVILYLNFGGGAFPSARTYDFVHHPFFFSGNSFLDTRINPTYDEGRLTTTTTIWNGIVSVYLLSTTYYKKIYTNGVLFP